jgi:hypothetical protein
MMVRKIGIIRKALVVVGMFLLVSALSILFVWQFNIYKSERNAIRYVNAIRERIPEPQGAVPEERRDNAMSTLSIDGIDFVGILEFPQYGSALPVCADWGKPSKYPCCFTGSVYDRSIQIGSTSQKGQYDFYRDISVGDRVLFTDMEGNRFTYAVTGIRHEKNADQSTLHKKESSLTLFIKNIYAFEYIIIYCDVRN